MSNNTPFFINIAVVTHQGKVRPKNEDALLINTWIQQEPMTHIEQFNFTSDTPVLCVVADGLGGHASGEVASLYTLRRLSEEIEQCHDEHSVDDILNQINKELLVISKSDAKYRGLGTTVVGFLFQQDKIIMFNVGDSRAYRYIEGSLEQINIDDTENQTQFPGSVSYKGRLTQCMGGHCTSIKAHFDILPLEKGYFLLCSDGLTDLVDEAIIQKCIREELSLEESVKLLYSLAMHAGGIDNISIILIHLEMKN